MRILNVDDNAENRYLIEMVGRAHGWEVVRARNGAEALEELDKGHFDLIISDILMPEVDGFQLCHEVKSRERTDKIPFVFYTATYTAKQDEEFGLSLGASRFIVKPVEPEEFMAIIDEVMDEAKRGKPPAQAKVQEVSDYLKGYNARLIHKLDRKIAQLEAAQRDLQASLEAGNREIVQRKRAEEERARLEAQFLQSQKLESVGRLAGGIAHDFNNLLTVINGFSEMLLGKVLEGDPLRSGLEEIRSAGERAAKLTRQLLAFSRKQVSNPRSLSITQVVGEIRNMIQRLVGDDVEVVTELAPSLPEVMIDEGQLHQVLLNLVVNARDAMAGGGRLTIETRRVELDQSSEAVQVRALPPGRYVSLTVTDTGSGMDVATLERIFEPFVTTKPEGSGTGLGLSTVYGIVKQCGGWIRVESQPGRGSMFQVYLPEAEAAAREKTESPSPIAAALRGTETVLVAEDNGSVRGLIAAILKEYGYLVLEAATGNDAVLLAERHPGSIDLLVADVQMPGMSGLELAKQLSQLEPNMRVLFASGYGEGVTAETTLSIPGVSYLQKPFAPVALAAKVREMFRMTGGARNAPAHL